MSPSGSPNGYSNGSSLTSATTAPPPPSSCHQQWAPGNFSSSSPDTTGCPHTLRRWFRSRWPRPQRYEDCYLRPCCVEMDEVVAGGGGPRRQCLVVNCVKRKPQLRRNCGGSLLLKVSCSDDLRLHAHAPRTVGLAVGHPRNMRFSSPVSCQFHFSRNKVSL